MNIKQKLTYGIGSIITVATISSAVITFNLNSIHATSEQTAVESVPFSIAAADAKYQSCQVQQFVTDASLTHDDAVLKEAENALKLLRYDFEKFEEMYKREGDTKSIHELEKMEAAAVELFETGKRMKAAYAISQADGDKVMEELDQDTETLAKLVDTLQKSQVQEAVNNSNLVMNQASSTLIIAIILAIIVLIAGIIIGGLLTKQITTSLEKFQEGLLSFFSFLNKKTNKTESIKIDGDDEFAKMAAVVNDNITHTQTLILQDEAVIADVKRVVALVKNGKIKQQVNASTQNTGLEELKTIFNEMLDVMAANVCGDINKVQAALEAYRRFDFTHRISDPTGQTSQGLNALAEIINEMLANSLKNGVELQGDAGNLKQAVEALSTASNQQAASLEETAAAMEEMTSNVQQNAQKANDMASMAAQTDASAKEGAELAQRTATAMTEIQTATQAINNAVAIIENIAFQTNILSLNAAVEAATAGDAGKGFAVVAQEVRNLANRSADAAKEIKAMAERAATKSNEGMSIANELTHGFEVIAGKIEQTTMLVQDVSNASREQMQGIGQINTAVTQLDQMTQENAKIAAEANNIANATIDKAQAMVADASSKNFVGKNEIQASVHTHKTVTKTHTPAPRPTLKPSASVSPRPTSPASKPSAKNSNNDDIWESF